MARIRSISIGFFQNEQLAALSSPDPRTLFAGLWLLADREGRLLDRPGRIRGELFPHNAEFDANAALNRLQTEGFIERYEDDGLRVIQITAFLKHQRPHVKEKPSELPGPSKGSAKRQCKRAVQKGSAETAAQHTEAEPNEPGEESDVFPPVFGLGIGIGSGIGGGVPAAPAATDLEPEHINTAEENNAKAAAMGIALPFSRPMRTARTGADPGLVQHRSCYGAGVLLSCARGVCIPAFLGNQWLAQLADDPYPIEAVARFVTDVMHTVPAGPVGDEPLRFWRAQWTAKHGSVAPARTIPTKSDQTRAAAREVLADFIAAQGAR